MKITTLCKFPAILLFFLLSIRIFAQQWLPVNPALGQVADLFELDGRLYTISNLGLFGYSDDDGASWQTRDLSEVVTLPNGITTCIAFFDQDQGLVGVRDVNVGNQLLRTADSGLNWEVAAPVYDAGCSSGFIPISFFRINDSTLVQDGLQQANYRITYDRGQSWQCSDHFTGPGGLQVLGVRSDPEWLLNDARGLHRTVDGGRNWTGIFAKAFVHYQLSGPAIFGLTTYFDEPEGAPVLYKTTDDFQTWEAIALDQFAGKFVELFVAVSEQELYMLTNGTEVYRSTDGGLNFDFVQTLSNQPFKAKKVNDDWYLYGRGLWKLTDELTSTEPAPAKWQVKVFPNPVQNTLYIGDHNFTAFELMSANGNLLQAGTITDGRIDLSRRSGGVYFLKLKSRDRLAVKKVVKK